MLYILLSNFIVRYTAVTVTVSGIMVKYATFELCVLCPKNNPTSMTGIHIIASINNL